MTLEKKTAEYTCHEGERGNWGGSEVRNGWKGTADKEQREMSASEWSVSLEYSWSVHMAEGIRETTENNTC